MNAKKAAILAGIVLVVILAGVFTVIHARGDATKVLAGKVERGEILAIVSGTGQIKPKTYVNIGATSFGRITHLYVKEGDHVHQGQVVATVESVQPAASVSAQQAAIASARTDISADQAAEQTAQADIAHADADLEQKQLDYSRYKELFAERLVSKADFDAKKAAYDLDVATVEQSKAALAQARATTDSARGKLGTANATLRSDQDALSKTISVAPFSGLVTNLPVREGETVVTGIQNAEGSTLMTIADMSVITAEVKIDETDIVNVKLGQAAEVSVDAVPGKTFRGHITEVGDQALLRSTGMATSQSTSGTEEAKDFKVIVTLDASQNLSDLRPGLSATAKITTADQKNVLNIPIQAICAPPTTAAKGSSVPAAPASAQGIFLLRAEKGQQHAYWIPLKLGTTGATREEVSGSIQEGDSLVTGTYQVLRVLKQGAQVKPVSEAELAPKSDSGS